MPGAAAPVAVAKAPSLATAAKFSTPSTATQAASLALALAHLPASTAKAGWVQELLHPGASMKPLASLPNLDLLEHPATSVAGSVAPGYVAQPAPLGLGDFGLGATPYALNTTHILGEVTFNSEPNETDPGSTGVIEPSAQGRHLGYVGSTNEFGIQLNTVVQNITFPGSDQGFFWTQNVVNWNDTGIHFVSDTFNFSAGSGAYIPAGTILSGCNNGTTGVDNILAVYGGVFQCVGGVIPVSAASYPVTIQLFNNASVNAAGNDVVDYSYVVQENGTHQLFADTYNSVVFNNPASPAAPAVLPAFSINGFQPAPIGLLRDAEIDLVGDIAGDNTAFRAINATVHLEYSNQTSGGWGNAPSAYNFGGDTGETSTGIADYWTPGHTLVVHQGPAMLYGLWNAQPSVSVPSGSIHLTGSITPSYGFVFVSNTPAVSDYLAADAPADNFSWLPTAADGSFNTYLPPTGGAWTSQYYVQAYADGFQEENGTPISATDLGYTLALTSHPGDLQAPLYMFGNAQAKSIGQNVTGSMSAPFDFSGLAPDVNLSFNHLNDYDYPSFEVFMAQGVTIPIEVQGVSQGGDAPTGAYYLYDGPSGPGGLLYPSPPVIGPLANYTSQINIYFGLDPIVQNEQLQGSYGQGGEIVLWGDTGASVQDVQTFLGSQGVFVGHSVGTSVTDVEATTAVGVQDVGSYGTHAIGISALGGSIGVESYSSSGAIYSTIAASLGSAGVEIGADFSLGSGFLAHYYDLPGSRDLQISGVNATDDSLGLNVTLSSAVSITHTSSYEAYAAIELDTNTLTSVSGVSCVFDTFCLISSTDPGTIAFVRAVGDYVGVLLTNDTGVHLTQSVFFDNVLFGVAILGGANNIVSSNSFILNGGSTNVYDPTDEQAFSTTGNYFNNSVGIGNYWADWHSGSHGVLNPYPVSPGVFDEFPLSSGGVLTDTVTFSESGLPAKVLAAKGWTVEIDGLVNHTTSASVSFVLVNGTFPDLVAGPSGYQASGSAPIPGPKITLSGPTESLGVDMAKGKTLTLTFAQKGIPLGGSLCVSLNGLVQCTTGKDTKFVDLTPGTYDYTVLTPAANVTLTLGKTVEPLSGSLTLTKSEKLTATYLYTYAVVFTETGFSGTWSVKIKGVTESAADGGAITFFLANATYHYSIGKETGYSSAGLPAKSFTVDGTQVSVSVTFTPKS